ncbi:hypothetical protein [Clostridium sp. JS66]|uniref:hypothetical protein n=1 Tax=Clostridium sp. JS66 TaxID=3064705 RepID=UPI00298E9489|nr:hypothetical protein [Clostridium sp. JS66]WPC42753.1 hypothetical protein Q6H37_04585 [Clostridium sp. JS66]
MNKKIKFMAPALCGAILASNLVFTNVQAAPIKNNMKNNLTASYSNTTYRCTAYADQYNNVIGSATPSDSKTHTYRALVIFYDDAGNELGEIHGNDIVVRSGESYTMSYGWSKYWSKADVHFYADNSPIWHSFIYR